MMQPRAQLFMDLFGEWDNVQYMGWISRMKELYLEARGLNRIVDQDDFTEFLRREKDE